MVYTDVYFYAPQIIQLLQEAGCMMVHLFLETRCYHAHVTTNDKSSIMPSLGCRFCIGGSSYASLTICT